MRISIWKPSLGDHTFHELFDLDHQVIRFFVSMIIVYNLLPFINILPLLIFFVAIIRWLKTKKREIFSHKQRRVEKIELEHDSFYSKDAQSWFQMSIIIADSWDEVSVLYSSTFQSTSRKILRTVIRLRTRLTNSKYWFRAARRISIPRRNNIDSISILV